MNLNQVTLPTRDLEASVAFYRRMGFRQIVGDSPDYARFECPQGEATLSLHRVEGPIGPNGAVVYFETDDLDADVARLQAAGLVFSALPVDQRWLWREAYLQDPAGHTLCLFRAGVFRKNPPWRLKEPQTP